MRGSGMASELLLKFIFPIKDEPSAWLMEIKADCLVKAGIISEKDRNWVQDTAQLIREQNRQAA